MGGQTVYIALHEIKKEGLLELAFDREDILNGQYFNMKCVEFMTKVFGMDCFEKWKASYSEDFLSLLKEVDDSKKLISKTETDATFSITVNLRDTYWQFHKKDIASIRSEVCSVIQLAGKLTLKVQNTFLRQFLEDVAHGIEKRINNITRKVTGIQTMFLFGGLAESDCIQKFMKSKFVKYSVMVPDNPGATVLHGAMQLEHLLRSIVGRKSRCFYAIGIYQDFVEGEHSESNKVTKNGKDTYRHAFTIMIDKDQQLQPGDQFRKDIHVSAKMSETKQKKFTVSMYQSHLKTFPEETRIELGSCEMYPPKEGWPDDCKHTLRMEMGETQLKMKVKDPFDKEYDTKADYVKSGISKPIKAAIDFGTSGSGFAYAYDNNIAKIYVNKWQDGSSNTDKAPTTILLDANKKFDSFGYEAQTRYVELCEDGKQGGWRYFQDFKMVLYQQQKISRDMMIEDEENKAMRAVEVFSVALAHLKKNILETIDLQKNGVLADDITYIITVPAIWSDAAKQFMREAATNEMVGISDDQLQLVLEPEAAAVYCAQELTERDRSGNVSFKELPVGHRYILVDGGGGTVDVATHEVMDGKLVLQLHVARGDDFGGQYFNRKCLVFLENMFGKDCFKKWKLECPDDFLNLLRKVEEIKKSITQTEKDIKFNICISLSDAFKESCGREIASLESDDKFPHAIKGSTKSHIILKHKFLRRYLEDIALGIKRHIDDISADVQNIQTIFLVGGLANSAFIREFIKGKYTYKLIVPEDPGVAVLKGTIQLANKPHIIAGRIARYSYGIGVSKHFVDGKDREDYKFTQDGEVLCYYVFQEIIEKDRMLKYGEKFITKTCVRAKLPETKQMTFRTSLYQSTQPSPTYYTEKGCTELGEIMQHPPEGGWPDYCGSTVEIVVGEAEFKFYVKEDGGREYETKVDFLLRNK